MVPGVHSIRLWYGTAYLIVGETLTLIDAGTRRSGHRIESYIKRLGRDLRQVDLILVTHVHPDHSGGAAWLRERTGARVLAHAAETKRGEDGRLYTRRFGPHFRGGFGNWYWPRCLVDGFIEDGQVLPIGGGLRVIHTPGHSPGHVCLYLQSQKVLFAGDLIINNGDHLSRPLLLPGMSPDLIESSLRKLDTLEVNALCCSHGKPVAGDLTPVLRRFIASGPPPYSWWRAVSKLAAARWRKLKRRQM